MEGRKNEVEENTVKCPCWYVAGVLIIAEITVYSAIAYYLQTYRGKKSEMEVGKEWNVYADKVVGPYLNW